MEPQSKREQFAPCLLKILRRVLFTASVLPVNYYRYIHVRDVSTRQLGTLQQIYETIKETREQSYFDIMKFAELFTFKKEFINKTSIHISFYKLKFQSCSNCRYDRCSANQTILYADEYFPLRMQCDYNNYLLIDYVTRAESYTYEEKRETIKNMSRDQKLKIIQAHSYPESGFRL
ncbi:hypothetical protein CKQ84_08035 [Shewanella sp. WE21]|nr:hypothetical protein CKQ84_08035 [Shewanella sp. WE21]